MSINAAISGQWEWLKMPLLSYLLLVFVLLASYPGLIPARAIATFPGVVCVTNLSSATCPSSGASTSVTGEFGGTLTVAVNVVLGTDPFNAFDIRVQANPSVLNPTSVDLTGSVLVVDSATLKAECINGVGSGCVAPLDGPGVVRVSVNDTGVLSMAPSGLLFSVTFHVVGLATDSIVGYQTGCNTRFGLCLLLIHPFTCFEGNCTTIAAEDPAFAVFGNLPALLPGYAVAITPSYSFNSGTMSGTFALTVANDTDGTVLYSKTISVSVKVDSAGDARFILVAPVAPAALGASFDVNTATGLVSGFVSGNPDVRNVGIVDILDVATVALVYGSIQGSTGYSSSLDLNQDGAINILDLALLASDYGLPAFH